MKNKMVVVEKDNKYAKSENPFTLLAKVDGASKMKRHLPPSRSVKDGK